MATSAKPDAFYMRRALELAKRAWGDTAPNPMVGAVLVKNGEIIGEGWHTRDGMPHAEIECLRNAKAPPDGATLYVSLEPCSTRGRTGACTAAIIKAGIAEVKIGTLDPNPAHAGRALPILRAAGIKCESGILEGECRGLNFIFNHAITHSEPLVALKYAVSADGKIAERRGVRTQITNEASRANMMVWRRLFSSIAVGRGTLESDNPSLTARGLPDGDHCAERLVFDASLNIARHADPKNFALFSDKFANKTRIVCGAEASEERAETLGKLGLRIFKIAAAAGTPEFWEKLKEKLFAERITSLYIEGGAGLIKSVCDARAADFAFEYRATKTIGDGGLPAFENGERPFDIDGKTLALDGDTLTFGEIKWKRTR